MTVQAVIAGEGTNCLLYTEDGSTWTGIPITTGPFNNRGYGAAWNGTMWVACGLGTNNLAYSSDGINWTGIAAAAGNFLSNAHAAAWNGSMWVAVGGRRAESHNVCWSEDGINWTGGTGDTLFSYYGAGLCVAWNGSMWVIGGEAGTNVMAYSADGKVWTGIAAGSTTFTTECHGVAWNGEVWVAVGGGTNKAIYSSDGMSWTAATSDLEGIVAGWGVAWDETSSKFWAVGTPGTRQLNYSADGMSWSSSGIAHSPLNNWCFDVAADDDKLLVVGGSASGYVLGTSTDGAANWTRVAGGASTFTYACNGVALNPSGPYIGDYWNGGEPEPEPEPDGDLFLDGFWD